MGPQLLAILSINHPFHMLLVRDIMLDDCIHIVVSAVITDQIQIRKREAVSILTRLLQSYMGVSINVGTPKWISTWNIHLYMDDLGVPLFQETSISTNMAILSFCVHCWLQATMLRALVFQEKA